jgi:hypothetical protein
MVRLFAAAAMTAVLAACGGGGSDASQERTQPTGAEKSGTAATGDSEEDRLASIFPGSDTRPGSASAVKLPRTKVGQPVQGYAHVTGASAEKPKPLQGVTGNIDGAELEFIQKCLGEVPPQGCDVIFQVTPTEPGPYSGELTFTMEDGSTVTAPVSGEATGDGTTTSEPPVGPSTTAPTPATPSDVVPETDGVPSDLPTAEGTYELP